MYELDLSGGPITEEMLDRSTTRDQLSLWHGTRRPTKTEAGNLANLP